MQIEAIVQGIRTMVDGGYRVTLDVNELNPTQAAELFYLKGKYTYLTIKEDADSS
jgi:hypothetical protein